MNDTEKSIKEKCIDSLINNAPAPIIVATFIFALVEYTLYICMNNANNLEAAKASHLSYTCIIIGIIILCLYVAFIIYSIVCWVRKKGSARTEIHIANQPSNDSQIPNSTQIPNVVQETIGNSITAHIVEQHNSSREQYFLDLNSHVQSSYWVLGTSLSNLAANEPLLNKMISDNVDIRLCMMNPRITTNNICLDSLNQNACVLSKSLRSIKTGKINAKNIKEKVACDSECTNLVALYHMLIDSSHFDEYYATSTLIKNSCQRTKDIIHEINQKNTHKNTYIKLRTSDSFMPLSITIVDKGADSGKMIIEFHIPFTSRKVLLQLSKKHDQKFFDEFVSFYETIWDRSEPV